MAFPSPSIRNITAPVQWFASRRVTLIDSFGVRSISVGVFSGIGLCPQVSEWHLYVIKDAYQKLRQVLVVQFSRLEDTTTEIHSMRIFLDSQKNLTRY
jgi:hypothetical protein